MSGLQRASYYERLKAYCDAGAEVLKRGTVILPEEIDRLHREMGGDPEDLYDRQRFRFELRIAVQRVAENGVKVFERKGAIVVPDHREQSAYAGERAGKIKGEIENVQAIWDGVDQNKLEADQLRRHDSTGRFLSFMGDQVTRGRMKFLGDGRRKKKPEAEQLEAGDNDEADDNGSESLLVSA